MSDDNKQSIFEHITDVVKGLISPSPNKDEAATPSASERLNEKAAPAEFQGPLQESEDEASENDNEKQPEGEEGIDNDAS